MPRNFQTRREACRLVLAGLSAPMLGAPSAAWAQSPPKPGPPTGTPFTPSVVTALARSAANRPYRSPGVASVASLTKMSPADYARIKFIPENVIWIHDKVGYAIEPLPPAYRVAGPVQINLVEGGTARRLGYDPGQFEFGKIKLPPAGAGLDFSGFRILKANSKGAFDPVASFRDASYFMAVARHQTWGQIAKPLVVRSANQNSEEAAQFRSIWIEKPTLAANALLIHALIDAPSLTAAFHFTLRADDATIIDTECTVFARTAVAKFGIAAGQATYFFGPLDRRTVDDVRPAVYEVKGAQMLTGSGEWLWRPLANRNSLQISGFVDDNPRGFGLIQRDRAFEDFLDADNQWQRRPSLWIEPIGEWGAGEVTLIEVPAVAQTNKNILLYWGPKPGLAAHSSYSFAYRQYWCWSPPIHPPGAIVALSRMGRTPTNRSPAQRRFLVQFAGEPLGHPETANSIEPMVWASAGKLASVRGLRLVEHKLYQVLFDLDPGSERQIELRVVLQSKGQPVSETWLFRWVQ